MTMAMDHGLGHPFQWQFHTVAPGPFEYHPYNQYYNYSSSSGAVSDSRQGLIYPAFGPIPRPVPVVGPGCREGFDLLLADLTLLSIIISFVSLLLSEVSLVISIFYDIEALTSLVLVGIPSFIFNTLALAGVTLPSDSPLVLFLTVESNVDVLINLFANVPGSLYSDAIGGVSLALGYLSFGMGVLSTYPQMAELALHYAGLLEPINRWYGCGVDTPGKLLQDVLNVLFEP